MNDTTTTPAFQAKPRKTADMIARVRLRYPDAQAVPIGDLYEIVATQFVRYSDGSVSPIEDEGDCRTVGAGSTAHKAWKAAMDVIIDGETRELRMVFVPAATVPNPTPPIDPHDGTQDDAVAPANPTMARGEGGQADRPRAAAVTFAAVAAEFVAAHDACRDQRCRLPRTERTFARLWAMLDQAERHAVQAHLQGLRGDVRALPDADLLAWLTHHTYTAGRARFGAGLDAEPHDGTTPAPDDQIGPDGGTTPTMAPRGEQGAATNPHDGMSGADDDPAPVAEPEPAALPHDGTRVYECGRCGFPWATDDATDRCPHCGYPEPKTIPIKNDNTHREAIDMEITPTMASARGLLALHGLMPISGGAPEEKVGLLPCPFCGRSVRYRQGRDSSSVGCANCDVSIETIYPNSCIERWNARFTPPVMADLAAIIERIEASVERAEEYDATFNKPRYKPRPETKAFRAAYGRLQAAVDEWNAKPSG